MHNSKKEGKTIFLSYLSSDSSRTAVYLSHIKQKLPNVVYIKLPTGVFKLALSIFKIAHDTRKTHNVYIVMSPSHLIVLFLRTLTRNKIILDAGWSLTEAAIARDVRSLKLCKIFFIDKIAFKFANNIVVETVNQKNFITKHFNVTSSKISVLLSGFNEKIYIGVSSVPSELQKIDKNSKYSQTPITLLPKSVEVF